MTENPTDRTGQFAFGLTIECVAEYLAEHGDDVADALLFDWSEAVRPIESPYAATQLAFKVSSKLQS